MLEHPYSGKEFVLMLFAVFCDQVGRIVEDSAAVPEILHSPELLQQIINCIGGEKIAVAKEVKVPLLSCSSASSGGWVAIMMSSHQ